MQKGNQEFRFRQFTVRHDQCAHRVGTDGVLLGAWAKVEGHRRILDIGTGSGLIALMAAQRNPQARVVGVEVDSLAAHQATENVMASPFADKVEVVCIDVRKFYPEEAFDCILSNPPYFPEETLPPDKARALARNASSLAFDELISAVNRLITPDGFFHVILPYSIYKDFISKCFIFGFNVCRITLIRSVVSKPPRRVLFTFGKNNKPTLAADELLLMDSDGSRSRAYSELTNNFYL